MTRRVCRRCGSKRSASKYTLVPRNSSQEGWCDACVSLKNCDYNMRRRYGITMEDYERMADEQGHRCACCSAGLEERPGAGGRFHIDHCHESGRVRALLCQHCNIAVGYVGDDPLRALQIAGYIIKTNSG